MMIFYVICLLVTILSLEILIVSGFRSANHRLLPLLIGLIALYNFYLVVGLRVGESKSISMLKDLLLIQVINLLIYFVVDFMEISLPKIDNFIIIFCVVGMDAMILFHGVEESVYRSILIIYVIASIVVALSMMLEASYKKKFSKRVRHNNMIVFWLMFVPLVTLIPTLLGYWEMDIVLPACLLIICLILDWLFLTDRLRDVRSYLKEELFHNFDVPAILFDAEFCYIDASESVKKIMPEVISEMAADPDNYIHKSYVQGIKDVGNKTEFQYEDKTFWVVLQEVKNRGKLQGYILRFIDITSQKKETETARELSRKKSEFLANMSHDLRSPLHAILGGSEIILSKNEVSQYSRVMLNRIHEAGESLLSIVNSILEYSKMENGNIELNPVNYNFKKTIESQAQMGFVNLKDSPVKLSIEVINEFPEHMHGDELRVRQIIQNILSNAIKYTENGYIHCIISTEITDDNRVRIEYAVQDSGVGMTDEQMANIFGDYVAYADGMQKESTGLGLSIVKRLTEMMDGYAEVSSTIGIGSTVKAVFYQELPLDYDINNLELHEPIKITKLDQLNIEKVWASSAVPTYTYPEATVLIVDDMEINRIILKEMLQPWGVQIDFAENGQEATEKVQDKEYNLIILDQMMPIMTGTEAADIITEIVDTPLCLLTANISDEMRSESMLHGFSDFLQKPVDANALKSVIEKHLPEKLRAPYGVGKYDSQSASAVSKESYIKSLNSFVTEMSQLYKVLPEYAKGDLSLFRNKVHGIKGVSKQLNIKTLAMSAEIMEMAAITNNLSFIDSFFDTFYTDLELTIAQTQTELESLSKSFEKEEKRRLDREAEANEINVDDIIGELVEGLDAYDIEVIDSAIEKLKHCNADDGLAACVIRIERAIEDFEYETASEILEQYLATV